MHLHINETLVGTERGACACLRLQIQLRIISSLFSMLTQVIEQQASPSVFVCYKKKLKMKQIHKHKHVKILTERVMIPSQSFSAARNAVGTRPHY